MKPFNQANPGLQSSFNYRICFHTLKIYYNKIIILKMRKIKFMFAFLAIVFMLSACEFSPEEIQPVGKIILENTGGNSGERPGPQDPPDDL